MTWTELYLKDDSVHVQLRSVLYLICYAHVCLSLSLSPSACNVLYLNSVETESLTGPQAIAKATDATLGRNPRPSATVVQFKVTSQGITLTDSQRRWDLKNKVAQLFFRAWQSFWDQYQN